MQSMLKPAVFLDRDNTLNHDPGYLSDPAAVQLLPGAAEGLRMLQAYGLPLVLISNQAGVGRGYFSEAALAAVHARLVVLLGAHGVRFAGVYYCLHAPGDGCDCRKPAPGMLRRAAAELQIDLAQSFMVGDKPSDVEAGRRAGCATVLLADPASLSSPFADAVCADLVVTARWIIERISRRVSTPSTTRTSS